MTLIPVSLRTRTSPQPTFPATSSGTISRMLQRVGLLLLLLCGWLLAAPSMAATCGPATVQGSAPVDYSTYCWLDFTGYNDTTVRSSSGQNFVFNLPGGATLSFNVKASGTALAAVTSPSWTGSAFGHTAFNGIPGLPVLYGTGSGTSNLSFTNIILTVGTATNIPFALVAADGESTNSGESLSFTTDGNPWTQLAQMANGGAVYPTLTGLGTPTVTETGVDGTVGSYAFATTGSPTKISTTLVNGGLEGAIFGVKFYAADLIITKSHTGNFIAGGPGSYNLLVHNNGPDTANAPGTSQSVTTVQDTLPAGLSYVSASGSGWTCAAAGQVVTCTSSNAVASGANLPAITLKVNVAATAAASISNTATVSNTNYNYNTSNDSSTDVVTIIQSDLSTSTKTVLDTNGGDTNPGDTLRYTITLTNSTAAVATGVSVSDSMPTGVGSLSVVSTPTGSTNSSTTSGGTNGTGLISVTGISVPANGSASIVYEVKVSASASSGATIDNTATISNPNGVSASPAAPTVTVSQSQVTTTGNKILYLYDDQSMTRTAQTSDSTAPAVNVDGSGATQSWQMTPGVATGKTLVLSAGTVSIPLVIEGTNKNSSNNRPVNVELLTSTGASLGNATQNVNNNNPTLYTYTLSNIPQTTLTAGQYLVLRITNNGSSSNRQISVYQKSGALYSRISFYTTTVINVDSVNFYSAAYPATTTQTTYGPGDIVYVRAVISDPFGSYDVNHATVTGTDPAGNVVATNAPMTQVADSGAATRTFEVAYTIPPAAPTGYWTASVTGYEGTEGTVQHTAKAAFNVGVPNLLVIKSVTVISDPVEGTTKPKSLPGAVMQYQITVSNNGSGPADNNSLVITDPLPATTKFLLGSVVFTDGTPNSGLSLAPANVSYSNVGSAGPWTYTPVSDGSGADPNVKALKIAPQGTLAGKSGATAPNFSVTFRIIIL